VNETLPSVTVLIAARPDQAEIKAVSAGRLLDYPREKLEMIVARGRQPSVQRNTALREAKGELIYFLDDDSEPPPDNLRRAVKAFADPKVQMIGGPNICPPEAPFLEQIFALVHASWLAFASSRARYAPVGKLRASSEKELILCNLIARRKPMLELGGFNEALYPNEENALMDELQKRDGKLLYDPELIVHRRPRKTLRSFAKMLLNYGRGRAEQVRLHPTLGSAVNCVPPAFCVYLIGLIAIAFAAPGYLPLALVPFLFYLFILLAQGALLMMHGSPLETACAVPLIFLSNLLYGLGFWRGLFTALKPPEQRPRQEVVVERIPL
jgi:succinoglycan biosynthesis protein ExoA